MEKEIRVIYHVDDEETPYLIKLPSREPPRLSSLKAVLSESNPIKRDFKFFFKSKDDDFGVVKEEIFEDESFLPLFNGRIVAWLVSTGAAGGAPVEGSQAPLGSERGKGVGETRPPSFHGGHLGSMIPPSSEGPSSLTEDDDDEDDLLDEDDMEEEDTFDETESNLTSVSQVARRQRRRLEMEARLRSRAGRLPHSEDFLDSEDAASSVVSSSRFTTSTDHTSVSRNALKQRQKRKFRRKAGESHRLERAGSISSVTDSTLSLNLLTVTLNMNSVNFLGISIVGQSNKNGNGDCGIYVGSIMKGGAVALDGRIDPGDMILQVNDINFENMSNDDAVRVLRNVVQKPGPIKLVIAKCWDPSPKGYLTLPRTEPVRPIDPGAWVAHTAAVRGDYPGRAPSVTTLSASSTLSSQSVQKSPLTLAEREEPLSINSGMDVIVNSMKKSDSGLEVRDRIWLKITLSNAFMGSDVVDWLFSQVSGFSDRREAKKYASQMLKNNFIKHAVNKSTFSEQCYYVFGGEPPSVESGGAASELANGIKQVSLHPPDEPPPPLPSNAPPWAATVPQAPSDKSSSLYTPIYNPAAPPPSANYVPYGSSENGYSTFHQSTVSSSGSSRRVDCQLLAPSGSESDTTTGVYPPTNLQRDCLIVNSVPLLNK
eukprot:TRINITY_DN4666_c0_g1_i1.p1 TRINITY_DN4666_c0_g1~~TRINITY_DN4666_c0_g1_i1.p1  ORF type:complete len:654 (+),score=236.38 TRINITY_DN4666_c0_g1_i1:110-2071(+)